MPTVRKVQSKINLPKKADSKEPEVVQEERERGGDSRKSAAPVKKACFFCKHKTEPAHWDIITLRRYTNDRGRINSRSRSGACAKHQRRVAREIKRARHLALLPFSSRI